MSKSDKLAVQLYSLRNMDKPLNELFELIAAAGYDGVETVGDHGLSTEDMNALLEEYGLAVCSSHVALGKLETDLAAVCRFNEAIGNDTVIVPWLAPDDRGNTPAAWQELGRKLGGLAEQVEEEGLRLLYHNHDFEMQAIRDRLALDWLIDGAGDAPLGLELDLAWVVRGGQDPLELLRLYEQRVPRVHVKDIATTGENTDEDGWADVGHGTLDWDTLLPAARQAGAEWFVVEHDKPNDGERFVKRSAAFLREAP